VNKYEHLQRKRSIVWYFHVKYFTSQLTENNYQFFDFRITTADVFEQRHLLTNGRTTGGFMCCPLSKPAETRLITPHIDDRAPIAANFWLATLIGPVDSCTVRFSTQIKGRGSNVSTRLDNAAIIPISAQCGFYGPIDASKSPYFRTLVDSWWRGTVVERRSLTGELSLSCARPAADGWPLMW